MVLRSPTNSRHVHSVQLRMQAPRSDPRWIQLTIDTGAGLFIIALVVSAAFEPSIRLLHSLR